MLARYLAAEARKLKRSLVALLCIAAPCLVALICLLIALHEKRAVSYDQISSTGAAFWAFAMLPMTVTALSVLMAQMEHGPRTWDYWLTLPGARPYLFLAKALVMLALVAAMSLGLFGAMNAAVAIVERMHAMSGVFDRAELASLLGRMMLASTLMCMIQLWVALRFRSFVPALVLGVGGTFVSVAAAAAREGAYFPWLMPLHIVSTDPTMQRTALFAGGIGGLLTLGAMVVHLGRREM